MITPSPINSTAGLFDFKSTFLVTFVPKSIPSLLRIFSERTTVTSPFVERSGKSLSLLPSVSTTMDVLSSTYANPIISCLLSKILLNETSIYLVSPFTHLTSNTLNSLGFGTSTETKFSASKPYSEFAIVLTSKVEEENLTLATTVNERSLFFSQVRSFTLLPPCFNSITLLTRSTDSLSAEFT